MSKAKRKLQQRRRAAFVASIQGGFYSPQALADQVLRALALETRGVITADDSRALFPWLWTYGPHE